MTDRHLAISTLIAACLTMAGPPAWARPPHKKALADYLGPALPRNSTTAGPATCPSRRGRRLEEPGRTTRLASGSRRCVSSSRKLGKPSGIPARIEAVADEDSDGDGVANLLELVTGHFPGEADDRPAAAELASGRAVVAELERRTAAIRGTRSSGSSVPSFLSSDPAAGCETRSMPSSPPSTRHAA